MANIIEIQDFSAPELDIYARLTENQLLNRADPANALFVAESPLVIGRAMDGGCVPVSFQRRRSTSRAAGRKSWPGVRKISPCTRPAWRS